MSNTLVRGSRDASAHAARIDASPGCGGLPGLLLQLTATLSLWNARRRQRRALGELAEQNDAHTLDDIGVTKDAALRESAKPFWRR